MTAISDISPLTTASRLAEAFNIPADLLERLRQLHQTQWNLEDESRRDGASVATVAAAKGRIDLCNMIRHQLIDAMDTAPIDHGAGPSPRLYSETAGELCDRLLILELKQRALNGSTGDHARQVTRVCAHLAKVAEQMIIDHATGCAWLPPRAGVKIYASANGQASS